MARKRLKQLRELAHRAEESKTELTRLYFFLDEREVYDIATREFSNSSRAGPLIRRDPFQREINRVELWRSAITILPIDLKRSLSW